MAMATCAFFLGCAQTGSYAPKPVTATYRLENFSKSNLQVVVRDLRAERNNSVELISAIQSHISNALAENASGHNHYTLTGFRGHSETTRPRLHRSLLETLAKTITEKKWTRSSHSPYASQSGTELISSWLVTIPYCVSLRAWKPAFGFLTMEVTRQPAHLLVV